MQAPPGWQQVNTDGFGDPQTVEVSALEAFNGALYAGTTNFMDGARIYRSQTGLSWVPVTEPGFGEPHDIRAPAILDLVVFNGRLYASTGRSENAGQIWRSLNGTTWAPMVVTGFSDPDTVDITALTVYDGMIYAGATNRLTGAQVWRSYTGDNNSWTQAAPALPGNGAATVTGFAVHDGGLYAAVQQENGPIQVWRTFGADWTTIVSDGFGDNATILAGGLAEFNGFLYAGAGHATAGAQLWRTHDGVSWTQAIAPGLGDANNAQVEAVFVSGSQLYISTHNAKTGLEFWRSPDGTNWAQINLDGFGDADNAGSNRSNAAALFGGDLYAGTANAVDGGELWRMQGPHIYLPSILHRAG